MMDCRAACFAIRLENTKDEEMFQWNEPRADQRWKSVNIPENHVVVGVYGSHGAEKTMSQQGNFIERFSFITANSDRSILDITDANTSIAPVAPVRPNFLERRRPSGTPLATIKEEPYNNAIIAFDRIRALKA